MKLLIFISLLLLSSCYYLETGKFNQEAYDDYITKRYGNTHGCILGDYNFISIDMNKPNFDFYLNSDTLNFNGLNNLDTFLTSHKDKIEDFRFYLVGRENVKQERIDSVISVLQKHNRIRFNLVYQKGFWEK
jgi:hypothetical protein